ncbi:MAG: acetate--CoA ligase family protein, partial [Rhodospirillales bacterium]|nr:acetate--CoA ligase family protein [Rhodospirillales bacterium]
LLALARERGLDAEGVLVEEMVGIGLEFVLGIRDTPVFGPMLTLGRGGVEVEVDPDVVMAYLPLGPAEIEALIQRLRVAPLLRGFRGRPAAHVAGLAEAVHRICEFYLANPELREIEINPLILDREGRVLALDALIARAGGEHG